MYLNVNEVLFINVDSADEKEASTLYKSRMTDLDDESILIEVPMEEQTGRLKKLHLGDELSVYYVDKSGVKYYFNTYVIGFKQDVIRMVKIRRPEPEAVSKIQRRTFLRVFADLEVAVKKNDSTRFITRTEDISGGGMSFYSESKFNFKEGDVLSCWILVNYKNGSVEHVPVIAEIVRIKNQDLNRNLAMLQFVDITATERQKLIKFCFERQLDFRNQ